MKNLSNSHQLAKINDNLNEMINLKSFKDFLNRNWVTYDNRVIKNKNLTDDHLINIIGHLNHLNRSETKEIFNYMILASSRGLTQRDLDKFQIPHVNQDGKLCLMDYDKNYEIKEVI